MWDLLDDHMLSCIATGGAWQSLLVLRQLERRCAQIEKAKTRLQCIRPLSSTPFSLRLGRDIRCVVLSGRLFYGVRGCEYGDRETQVFATAIASGALPNLTHLGLAANNISDVGMQAFASAVASGALAQLRDLYLDNNRIGDVGVQAFATAVASGSMALKHLLLHSNRITDLGFSFLIPLLKSKLSGLTDFAIGSLISDKGMKEFAGILAMGAQPNLTTRLGANNIGDSGMQAFASPVASGSLPMLEVLHLEGIIIGDTGLQAFASAVTSGSLASLKKIIVDDKYVRHPQLMAACQARGIEIG